VNERNTIGRPPVQEFGAERLLGLVHDAFAAFFLGGLSLMGEKTERGRAFDDVGTTFEVIRMMQLRKLTYAPRCLSVSLPSSKNLQQDVPHVGSAPCQFRRRGTTE